MCNLNGRLKEAEASNEGVGTEVKVTASGNFMAPVYPPPLTINYRQLTTLYLIIHLSTLWQLTR